MWAPTHLLRVLSCWGATLPRPAPDAGMTENSFYPAAGVEGHRQQLLSQVPMGSNVWLEQALFAICTFDSPVRKIFRKQRECACNAKTLSLLPHSKKQTVDQVSQIPFAWNASKKDMKTWPGDTRQCRQNMVMARRGGSPVRSRRLRKPGARHRSFVLSQPSWWWWRRPARQWRRFARFLLGQLQQEWVQQFVSCESPSG